MSLLYSQIYIYSVDLCFRHRREHPGRFRVPLGRPTLLAVLTCSRHPALCLEVAQQALKGVVPTITTSMREGAEPDLRRLDMTIGPLYR